MRQYEKKLSGLPALTLHHQLVGDPAWLLKGRMPHQAVQLLPVHAAQGVQREEAGHGAGALGAVLDLALQVRVPRDERGRAANGSAGSGQAE